jgi:hypothetical protein
LANDAASAVAQLVEDSSWCRQAARRCDIEQSKRGRHGNEHVDGDNPDCFVAQEPTPRRRKRSDSSHHVFCDRGLADLDALLQELAVDA